MALNKVDLCGKNTSKLPLLSNEEKEQLFIQMEQGDPYAREHLIEGNLRLVLSVIQRFSGNSECADDLFQIGCIGLMKAIDNFDRSLNVRFSTYAVPMIMGECKRYLRDSNSIRVSRSLRDIAYKAIYTKEQFLRRSPPLKNWQRLSVPIKKLLSLPWMLFPALFLFMNRFIRMAAITCI